MIIVLLLKMDRPHPACPLGLAVGLRFTPD